jgi:hypothetical protein
MPDKVVTFRDKKTGKVYQMPWSSYIAPTPADAAKFIDDTENPSSWTKAKNWIESPLTNLPTKIGKSLAEPLYKFGEEGTAKPTGKVDKKGKPVMKTEPTHPYLGPLARGTAAYLESLGLTGSSLTSPANVGVTALTLGAGAAANAGRAGLATSLSIPGRALGATQLAHGAYGVYSEPTMSGKVGRAAEAVLGGFGAAYNPNVAAAKPAMGRAPIVEPGPPPAGAIRVGGNLPPMSEGPIGGLGETSRRGLPSPPAAPQNPYYVSPFGDVSQSLEQATPSVPDRTFIDVPPQVGMGAVSEHGLRQVPTYPKLNRGTARSTRLPDMTEVPAVEAAPAQAAPLENMPEPQQAAPPKVETATPQPDPVMRGFSDSDIQAMAEGGDESAIIEGLARPSLTERFKQLFQDEAGAVGNIKKLKADKLKSGKQADMFDRGEFQQPKSQKEPFTHEAFIQSLKATLGRLKSEKGEVKLPSKDDIISPKMQRSIRKVYDDIATSGLTVIKNLGGDALERLIIKNRLDAEQFAGNINSTLKKVTKGLTPEELTSYIDMRDKGAAPLNDKVKAAFDAWKNVDNLVMNAAEESGAGMAHRGETIPIEEKPQNFPHIYPPEFFSDANRVKSLRSIMKEGYSYKEAKDIFNRAAKLNERLIDPETGKNINAEGYRRDINADYQHYNDIAKRISQANDFGPLDTSDSGSPISQLIARTDNPARVAEIVRKYLGKSKPSDPNWARVNAKLSRFETFTKLSHFIVNNSANLAMLPVRSSGKGLLEALGKVTTDYRGAVEEAEKTGALQSIYTELVRETGGPTGPTKWFGIQKGEEINRTISAIAGKRTALDLFQRLKANPQDVRVRSRLENLILENPDKLLSQEGLNEVQVNRAGNRMSEITQGRASNIDLPKTWTDEPYMVPVMLFKRYAYQQSRNIYAAIKQENPLKVATILVGLMNLFGEATGDINAALRGGSRAVAQGKDVKEEVGKEIAKRGKYPTIQTVTDWIQNPTKKGAADNLERLVNNLSQAWALGYLGDLGTAIRQDRKGLAANLAGPVIGDIGEASYHIGNLDARGLARQAARMVPIFGGGLSDALKKQTESKNQRPNQKSR